MTWANADDVGRGGIEDGRGLDVDEKGKQMLLGVSGVTAARSGRKRRLGTFSGSSRNPALHRCSRTRRSPRFEPHFSSHCVVRTHETKRIKLSLPMNLVAGVFASSVALNSVMWISRNCRVEWVQSSSGVLATISKSFSFRGEPLGYRSLRCAPPENADEPTSS